MSGLLFPGSAGWTTDSTVPDSSTPSSANQMSGVEECLPPGSPASPSTTTFVAFMPHRTLQKDGTVEEGFAEREVIDALHQPTGNKEPLILSISSAADSPAKTSQSPDSEQGSRQASAAPFSSSSQGSPMTLFGPEAGSSLRTFPDFFPPKAEEISPLFSRRWPSSGFTTAPGVCWTADTSESPNADGACSSSLADVLQVTVPARYFLSPKAAAGILRRAKKRGRELPSHLLSALSLVAASQADGESEPTKQLQGKS